MPLLELRSVSTGYSGNRVLHDVNLILNEGEIVTLVGANGAGKSTVVKTISGLMKPESGQILLDGAPIGDLPPSDRLRRGIAHVPEGRQVFLGMTVRDNLDLGAYSMTVPDHGEHMDAIWKLFPVLHKRLSDIAGNFSGGQQQMLAIARGLMSKPRILLLDEPSLGIAPLLVSEIFRLIATLRDKGFSILLAEQNARLALTIADRGYVFQNGRIHLSGSANDLLNSPEVAERYLGVGSAAVSSEAASLVLASRLRAALNIGA